MEYPSGPNEIMWVLKVENGGTSWRRDSSVRTRPILLALVMEGGHEPRSVGDL